MKKVPSRPQSRHQKSDSVHIERELHTSKSFQIKNLDLSCISLNTFTPNNPQHSDLGLETLSNKQSRGQSSGKNYENQYHKLCNEIRESYLEIKNKVIENDPNFALILKRHVPIDQGDETIMSIEAITVIQYMNKIFDKIFELKKEAEAELQTKKEDECNDYESMLQKLEAEVRQHIRIEQQLKLYVESTQAKLDELEKTYDPEKMEAMKKENEDLKNENSALAEKVKKRDSEIEIYKKELQSKSSLVKDLEHQTDSIPSLRNRIKDLERFISQNSIKVSSSNVLKFSNKTNKDNENLDKSSSHHQNTTDSQIRKTSQPILGSRSSEVSKHRHHEKDKENIETYKLDLSKYMYDNAKGNRSTHYEPYKSGDHSRHDTSMTKSSSKREDKLDDFGSVLDKMKKPRRSSHSRNNSKNNRSFDQALNNDDISEQGLKSVDYKKGKKDMIESTKSNYDKRLSFAGSSIQEMGRKSWDNKGDYKIDYRLLQGKNHQHKEALEPEGNVKNTIPKPRPSVGHENSYMDFAKHRKDNDYYDLNKLKVSSPKKALQDRSQSVDAKQRLHKQLKSREETIDKHHHKEQPRPSVGASHVYTNSYTISRSHHGSVKQGHY